MPKELDDFMTYANGSRAAKRSILKPEKAYKNLAFLNSAEARPVRVLAEFLEPGSRFRKHRVKDTIVFFGSARSRPMDEAQAALDDVQGKVRGEKRPSSALKSELARAQRGVKLARYYEDARELSRRLTKWSMGLKGTGRRYLVCSGGGPG